MTRALTLTLNLPAVQNMKTIYSQRKAADNTNPSNMTKYIVFQENLKMLMRFCCYCGEPGFRGLSLWMAHWWDTTLNVTVGTRTLSIHNRLRRSSHLGIYCWQVPSSVLVKAFQRSKHWHMRWTCSLLVNLHTADYNGNLFCLSLKRHGTVNARKQYRKAVMWRTWF